ncbi:DUF892 family protein [Vibrio parahaemolyticus]
MGDSETKQICERIIVEEEAMAAWLREHLSKITQDYLTRTATPGAEAKR